ncbi:M20 family metallopeptidase [Nesterenkonia sp. AN1]|uniref:M20 family metallopeptidase n=1 Tax=Nesterenkonia sp. AN1 TaxID=652017 RepID=UPI0004B60AA1|nr:M20 family metallopeptidase [Nesterenkonia sp. AN1]
MDLEHLTREDTAVLTSAQLLEIQTFITEHLKDVLEDLRRIVHCETPSQDKALLDAGLTEIRALAIERLGEPSHEARTEGGEYGDALELLWPGAPAAADDAAAPVTSEAPVTSVCHYDTVWPAGTLSVWPMSIDGDRLTGPGVLDMKFGIVQTIWAVLALRSAGIAHAPVRLLLTGDEEIGSVAGRPVIEAAAKDSRVTLVPEPSAGGQPKDRRKGMVFADITVHGVEAHAGLEPENGASAVHALAVLVPEIVALAAPERGTTVNVGTLQGGTGRNVVAGRAECLVDVRVTETAEQDRVADALRALTLPEPYRSDDRLRLELQVDANRPPMNPTPASEAAMARLAQIAAGLGRELSPRMVGGASDANFISALGLPVLDGLGAVGEGPHAWHEHLLISGVAPQTALLAGMLAE